MGQDSPNLCCRTQSPFPHVALDRPLGVILDRKRLLLNDLGHTSFNVVSRVLVTVVPDLMEEKIDCLQNLRQPPRFLYPFMFSHDVRQERRLDAPQGFAERDEVQRPDSLQYG